jgi:hypothetical protein
MNYAVDFGTALSEWVTVNSKSADEVWGSWTKLILDRLGETAEVRILEYTPDLPFPNSWLPVVESRIRASVMPADSDGLPFGEWLTEDAARAAIAFLRAGQDVLPTEPHIYGTEDGDFVAEFELPEGRMTSIVSDDETTLFAVHSDCRAAPLHDVIHRGSNQYRDQLASFTKNFRAGTHGQMVTSK